MPETSQVLSVFGWFAVASVAALAGFCVIIAVRRWTQREESVETFTFQDLRDMRSRGEITEREFAAMRAALVAQMSGEVPSPPSLLQESGPAEPAHEGGDDAGPSDEPPQPPESPTPQDPPTPGEPPIPL